MTQLGELARVKARIRALADKTVSNGCTEAEAMAAAEMVGRLLERYALSMDEVELRATPCVQADVHTGFQRRRAIDGCVTAIARFCACKVWLTRGGQGITYAFFGFATDTELAIYLFAVIDRAITDELAAYRRANPRLRGSRLRLASASFQHGMAARVAQRLDALRAAREETVAAARPTGTVLVVVKQGVVEDAFRAHQVRLVAARKASRRVLPDAYQQGLSAGERVNLNRPVRGSRQERLG